MTPQPPKNSWEKEFIEKGADLEHQRWVRWQKWCHKVLRENCPSSELEKTLERWDKQITTSYSKLSEQEKESDRKETRNYLPLIRSLLSQVRQEEADKYLFMSRKLAELVGKETIKETLKAILPEERLPKVKFTDNTYLAEVLFSEGVNSCLAQIKKSAKEKFNIIL